MKVSEQQKEILVKNAQCELIKGDFAAEDAREIINHLLQKKINFHEIRSFGSEIRQGKKDGLSEQRMKELRAAMEHLAVIIKEAELSGKKLRIVSHIDVEIV